MKLNLAAAIAALFIFFSDSVFAQQGMGVGTNNPQEMLDVTGAIKIGTDINNSNAAPTGGAGTIRFRAGQFEGWDGGSWIPLGGGGGNSPFVLNGNLVEPDNTVVNLATDDFIFGSPSLADDGDTDHDGRFFYDKSKGAFRAGLVTGDQWNDIKRGNQSFAVGYDVTASGDYSMTLGERSWATETGAIAMGRQAYAEGEMSFAWGNDVQATGEGSVALGRLAFSTADFSYAVGTNVNASAEYSMAVGAESNATASSSIALGKDANATAESALALGHDATATAYEAAAIGYDVIASGERSISFGHKVNALSAYEVVLGRYNSIYIPSSTTSWQATDRLFSIGNGTGNLSRSNALTVLKNGNIGIGTSAPGTRLHVQGPIRMADGNQQAGYIPVSDVNGTMVWTDPTTITTASDGDGDATNELQTLSQSGTDVTLSDGGGTISVADNDNSSSNELQTLSISGNDITLSNGGGTVSVPVQIELADSDNDTKIQVEESADEDIIRFDVGGTEQLKIRNNANGAPIFDVNSVGGNLYVGKNTGNVDAGVLNTFIGQFSGEQHNTGSRNTIIGSDAGRAHQTGGDNTLIGSASGFLNTSGVGNVFIGQAAGYFETGSDKLYIENTSSNNPLIYGEFDNDIVGINGNLGVGTSAPAAKLDVVGSESTTHGRNAAIRLANTATAGDQWVLRAGATGTQTPAGGFSIANSGGYRMTITTNGNVGVRTTAPGDELHVEGSIRMVDGNEADGYVATSDANGTMTWENPRRAVNFIRQPQGATGANSNAWVDFVSDATKTIDVISGDIISVWADCNVRFTSGSGNDDLQYKVRYSGCASGDMEDRLIRFDEDSGHDNWNSLAYADAMVAPCTGTLTFEYSIRRITGDDPWEAFNGVVIFRRN